jgi:hypothetical protein
LGLGGLLAEQQVPKMVIRLGAQQELLSAVGIRPLAQQTFKVKQPGPVQPPSDMFGIFHPSCVPSPSGTHGSFQPVCDGWHWSLFGPLGVCPAGQQIPVVVSWLSRQQVLPAGLYPLAQQFGSVELGEQPGCIGFPPPHLPSLNVPLRQHALAPLASV